MTRHVLMDEFVDAEPAHLLPANSTKFEISIANTSLRLCDIDVPIEHLWNPDKCPLKFLPFLAWALSVDVWDEDWPEARKRRMCSESLTLHGLKGCVKGLERYLSFIDATIVEKVLPPQQIFARPARSTEEKQAFLEQFRQLRIHPFRVKEQTESKGFFVGSTFVGSGVATKNTAYKRYGKRAVIWDDGHEAQVKVGLQAGVHSSQVNIATDRIVIPGRAHTAKSFAGKGFVGSFVASSPKVSSRILNISANYQWDSFGSSQISHKDDGLDVVSLKPERVFGKGYGSGRATRSGFFAGKSFISRDTSADRVFDRYYLLEKERITINSGLGLGPFVGSMRTGIEDYKGFFRIQSLRAADGLNFKVGSFAGKGFAKPLHNSHEQIMSCIVAWKHKRDKITFSTQTKRRLWLSDKPSIVNGFSLNSWVDF